MISKLVSYLRGKGSVRTEKLVQDVADRSLESVCRDVEGHMGDMSLAEARGYVRARATQVVLREARLAIANSPDADFTIMANIVRAVTDRLVPQVIRRTHVGNRHFPRVAA